VTKPRQKNATPKVGSKVKLTFGGREVVATVIEDRGPLGVGGRRLLRVRLDIEAGGEPIEFELPAADVRVAA
jgi:hypothetical protein